VLAPCDEPGCTSASGRSPFPGFVSRTDDSEPAARAWQSERAIDHGASVGIDSEGHNHPSAFALSQAPESEPRDPLHFVTELRGKVKVITHDRMVYPVRENSFSSKLNKELPDIEGKTGRARICLEPKRAYVL
jgi:hypothetical protein